MRAKGRGRTRVLFKSMQRNHCIDIANLCLWKWKLSLHAVVSGISALCSWHQTNPDGRRYASRASRLLDTRIRQMFKYLFIFRAKIQVSASPHDAR